MSSSPAVRMLGRVDYRPTLDAMVAFTAGRSPDTPDEIWLCEHPPTYTQGIAGRAEHVHDAGDIPVVPTQRGGQATFHGPGQVVAYPLIDLRRLGIYVKEYVYRLEHCAIRTLGAYDITGHRVAGAPGIYARLDEPGSHALLPRRPAKGTAGAPDFAGLGKVAALGIKVSRHCTYHGLALNVAMDLRPFAGIDPCGYRGLATVDMATLGAPAEADEVARRLGAALASHLSA